MRRFPLPVALLWMAMAMPLPMQATDAVVLPFQSMPQAQFHFQGPLGDRIRANLDQWLLPAPAANPGMIEMFKMRDRHPAPDLVPWAGEFVGKYLISAIQALRMTDRPELRQRVEQTIAELLATQAPDGYLGPFPSSIRLKANWDLWGHYHVLQALMMWHERTGDPASLQACRRAADLICATFLGGPLRVVDAGSPEMNMAVIHALGRLYRLTREARYLQLITEIERDWESAGDYLRTGLAGIEFFKTPKPRWESLHNLQGLLERYRTTRDERYARAFSHHWQSIRQWDRRNTGGFSSKEQASGNAFEPTPIETCSTVAWMALTVDFLHLTGDSTAADELELSTFNAASGAQHPSGRWWTYSTPMDGVRKASAHSIVFQARPGTPELNCCSVNGPRSLGMLSEWAVLQTSDGLALNYFGPGGFQGKLPDNTPVALEINSEYPVRGRIQIRVEPLVSRRFTLRLRIPQWSKLTTVRVNNTPVAEVLPGRYLELRRLWRGGDRISLQLDLGLRTVAGANEAEGRISVYRGPLLLAYDQRFNAFDEDAIPSLDPRRFSEAKEVEPETSVRNSLLSPWVLIDLPAENGRLLRLCDFASAGVTGTSYRSWLPATTAE